VARTVKRFEITITAVVEARAEDDLPGMARPHQGRRAGLLDGVRVVDLGSEVEERTPSDAAC